MILLFSLFFFVDKGVIGYLIYPIANKEACTQDYAAEKDCTLIFDGGDCSSNDYPAVYSPWDYTYCTDKLACVYNYKCYPHNSMQTISGKKVFCNANKWFDFDNRKLACEGADDCKRIISITNKPTTWKWIKAGGYNIGEYDNLIHEECCGDDPKEYFISNPDGSSACCDSQTDIVYNGVCLTEVCNDGADNDGDGSTDCWDTDCSIDIVCPEGVPATCTSLGSKWGWKCQASNRICSGAYANCNDGTDNDKDGNTDCWDPNCPLDVSCPQGTSAICSTATNKWECPRHPGSPYGINAHIPWGNTVDEVSKLGVGFERMELSWAKIETSKGQFNWEASDYDCYINEINRRGVDLLIILGDVPSWANGGLGPTYAPINCQDWYDFVYQTVNRYKYKVKYWEILNEPDLGTFWKSGSDSYVNCMLANAYLAAKAADQNAKIVAPAVNNPSSSFLTSVLTNGLGYIDIVSVHTYSGYKNGDYASTLSQIDTVKSNLAGYGVTNFWATEIGAKSNKIDFYQKVLEGRLKRGYPKKFFFYAFTDADSWNLADKSGTFPDYSWSYRSEYYTYKDFIKNNPY